MDIESKILYEDNDVLVIDKPAGISVYSETQKEIKTLIELLIEKYPDLKEVGNKPRYGIIHRLDKETSGIILVAKNNKALFFLQKKFKTREIEKKYTALVVGNIKDNEGTIETMIGRSPKDWKKQKVFLAGEPGYERKRKAVTQYKIIKNFSNYTLLEITPKTGRKHQIRCHLSYIQHPIAGDKIYGFKNQPCPKDLSRHFLHASYLQVKLPNGETKEFKSDLPEELNKIIIDLKR